MGRSSPINAAAPAAAAGGHHLNMKSPIPYLFGGLGLMLALIAMALLILACSYRRFSNSSARNPSDEEKPAKPVMFLQPEMEPKINLVIMAGDEKPRYLAMPVSSINHSHQHLQA